MLTKGKATGLVVSASLDRLGAFFAEAGGSYMNSSRTAFTFNSPQNVQALTYIAGPGQGGLPQVRRSKLTPAGAGKPWATGPQP